jgi:mannan endo-1,4-beta-mannosidase
MHANVPWQTGYKIVRVWGFGDTDKIPDEKTGPGKIWYHYINTTGGYINYGENGIQRLDYAVSRAEKLGLKLVLPLMNNWSDWGGQLVYNTVFGFDYNWYEHPRSQEVYRDYVKAIVTRYKNSTAIFAWELGNEPRCPNCENSVITNWAANVSAYIKQLDPNHMVTLGDEGWFGPADGYTDGDPSSVAYLANYNGVDFVANLQIQTLDYGVFHLYPNLWGYPYEWGNLWIQQHDDAGANVRLPHDGKVSTVTLTAWIGQQARHTRGIRIAIQAQPYLCASTVARGCPQIRSGGRPSLAVWSGESVR